jgi:hypothetical protein
MEQALLDSSKFKIYSMSIDSRFADQVYKGTGDFMIRLPSTYRNIMRIAVSSVELPLVEYLFSAEHGNLNLSVAVATAVYDPVTNPVPTFGPWVNLRITAGNYSSSSLAAEIERVLQTVDTNFLCTLDPIAGFIRIRHNGDLFFKVNLTSDNPTIAARPTHWGLGYYLGIRTKGPIISSGAESGDEFMQNRYAVMGTAILLTQPIPYYLLQLQCPDMLENITHRVSAGASIPAFAKLVLRDGAYQLQFVDGGDWMRREYTFLAPSNISQLRVKILDPYGEIVNMQGMDWSLTFEMYEVVNQRTYRGLADTYERP